MIDEPKIIIHDKEDDERFDPFTFGFYDYEKDEIHILSETLLFNNVLKHELIHRKRRNMVSMKLYRSFNTFRLFILTLVTPFLVVMLCMCLVEFGFMSEGLTTFIIFLSLVPLLFRFVIEFVEERWVMRKEKVEITNE